MGSSFSVTVDGPLPDGTGWRATFNISNPFGEPVVRTVSAVCAVVAS